MLLSDLVLIACVGQINPRLVQLFARKCALLKEILAAVKHFLLCVQLLLRSLRVKPGFLQFLGEVGGSSGLVRCLCLSVGTFVLLGGSRRSEERRGGR